MTAGKVDISGRGTVFLSTDYSIYSVEITCILTMVCGHTRKCTGPVKICTVLKIGNTKYIYIYQSGISINKICWLMHILILVYYRNTCNFHSAGVGNRVIYE